MKLRKLSIVALALVPFVATGCSSLSFGDRFLSDKKKAKKAEERDKKALAAIPDIPAKSLLNAGIQNVNVGNNKKAQKAFDEISKQHPFSKEAQRSLVLSAYAHYEARQYDQTVAKAERFIELYPGADDAAYMQYLVGESYFKQINSILLDQADTRKGLRAYSNLVRLYPESKYTDDAKLKMVFMSDQLAGKEMQIGRYYQERRQHLAAVNRFRLVAKDFQTTRHIEEALYRLTESYLALGVVSEAQTAAALLEHNYPESQWYRDASKLLTGKKLKPQVNKRSRLSNILPGSKKKADDNDA